MIDEIMEDTLEMMEPEGLEGEADAEVDRIMQELTAGMLEKATVAPTSTPAARQQQTGVVQQVDDEKVRVVVVVCGV